MEEKALEKPELLIAGRKFQALMQTTFEQDLYIMDHVRSSGIENVSLSKAGGKKLEGEAEEMVMAAYKSGHLFHLLAGILGEEGVPWTPEQADRNAIFFSKLTDPKDKKEIQGSIVAVVLSFFLNEESSSELSPNSFVEPTAEPKTDTVSIEDVSSTENGMKLSDS